MAQNSWIKIRCFPDSEMLEHEQIDCWFNLENVTWFYFEHSVDNVDGYHFIIAQTNGGQHRFYVDFSQKYLFESAVKGKIKYSKVEDNTIDELREIVGE